MMMMMMMINNNNNDDDDFFFSLLSDLSLSKCPERGSDWSHVLANGVVLSLVTLQQQQGPG